MLLHVNRVKIRKAQFLQLSFYVIRPGLEPGTYCLEGSCSIQLS